MAHKFISGIPLFVGGVPAMADACCCSTDCPCCYYAITIKRDAGATFTIRAFMPSPCDITTTTDAEYPAFQCGDETFPLTLDTISPPEGCTCYGEYNSDVSYYDSDPCSQTFYLPSSEDDVCNYDPPGIGTGVETHVGAVSIREVIAVTVCYDPCGTITIEINHKVYMNFGVWVHDEPPPLVGSITDTFVSISTDLVLDSTWTWTGVTCPNCESLADLGAPTSETLAPDYTKTWGTAFTHCGGSSSFTLTIPGACSATGLEMIGGGTPCDC